MADEPPGAQTASRRTTVGEQSWRAEPLLGHANPHLHIIATSGGWDAQARPWVHLDYVPYAMLRKQWQWPLLTMLRQTVKTQEIPRLVHTCDTRYRQGFVTNVPKGDVPAR